MLSDLSLEAPKIVARPALKLDAMKHDKALSHIYPLTLKVPCTLYMLASTSPLSTPSLLTVKPWRSEGPAGWPAASFHTSPGRTSASWKKKKMLCAEATSAKEPQWTRATPTSPVALSRFACHGQCICHSVSTPWSQGSLALASVKSFISLFISGLGSHLSPSQRPPSIIPMGEKVRKGKYILI